MVLPPNAPLAGCQEAKEDMVWMSLEKGGVKHNKQDSAVKHRSPKLSRIGMRGTVQLWRLRRDLASIEG